MFREQSRVVEYIAEIIGFIISYFIFTTVLFFILTFLEKIPETWNYLSIMIITISIVIAGKIIDWWLN